MMLFFPSSPGFLRRFTCLSVAAMVGLAAPATAQVRGPVVDMLSLVKLPVVDSLSLRSVFYALTGRSGKLLARFVAPPSRSPFSGNLAFTTQMIPGVQSVASPGPLGRFSLITMRSFGEKVAGSVGLYRVGFWPRERGSILSAAYDNPEGFIEVTRDNQDTRVSEHFRLRDFLTHDQKDVWPKYLVLREPLLDKLELIIQDLELHGVAARNVRVLSGFRTPEYNGDLGDGSGRAMDSRHQFGDAADIYIDDNNDGRMDDLNHDGRVTFSDVRVVLAAAERVEAAYPDLAGGVGLYHGAGSRGPFAHIDVRGAPARWVRGPAHRGHKSKGGKRKARSHSVRVAAR